MFQLTSARFVANSALTRSFLSRALSATRRVSRQVREWGEEGREGSLPSVRERREML